MKDLDFKGQTNRNLTKGCDCMKKKSIIVICAVLVISGVATVLVLTGNRGNVSNVKRVVGYSALYGENSIKEAFDVIEKKFAKDFEGCTLTELRYDEDVENRFAEEIEKYHKENNQELIVVLSTFDTDEKGGDGGFNPKREVANLLHEDAETRSIRERLRQKQQAQQKQNKKKSRDSWER